MSFRVTLMFFFSFVTAAAWADQISIPHPPQANTKAKAADMKANFDTIVEESNLQDARIGNVESNVADLIGESSENTTSVYLGLSTGASFANLGTGISECIKEFGANATVMTTEVFMALVEAGGSLSNAGWGRGDYSTGLERYFAAAYDADAGDYAGMMLFSGVNATRVFYKTGTCPGAPASCATKQFHCMTRPD